MCSCVTWYVLACGLQVVTINDRNSDSEDDEDEEDDQAVANAQFALAAAVDVANKRKEAKKKEALANVRTFVCTE